MNFIDSHHHFWHPARGDYGWMPIDDSVLSQPYTPADLNDALTATGVTRTVVVQAAPSVEETEYLLGIADATPHVAAVVGWINFEDRSQLTTLQRLAAHPKFVGVRPMIQDLPDVDWMLRDDVQWAYQALIDLDLTFDCLGVPRHLNNFHQLLTRYPELRAVVDHCMKPHLNATDADSFSHWADGMSRLAEDTGVYCKLSGLVTEAESDWSFDVLKPYTDHVFTAFGADRVMWGSDWPVARLRCEYEEWFELARQLTDNLTNTGQQQVFAHSADRFYQLSSD
jgi:L-fuconolactonase